MAITTIPRQPVGGNQYLQSTFLQHELQQMDQKEKDNGAGRMSQFLMRAAGAPTKAHAFGLMGEYGDLFVDPPTLQASIKAIDEMFPEAGKPVKVTAHSADGMKEKTLYLPENVLPMLGDQTYVQQVFGPEFSMVSSGDDKADLLNYYELKGGGQEGVAPEAAYRGRFIPGSAPEGLVPEPELRARQSRADDIRGQRGIEATERRNQVLENLAIAGLSKDQVGMRNSAIGAASREIDKFMELDSVLSVLKDQRKAKERAMEIVVDLIDNQRQDPYTAAKIASEQIRRELEEGQQPGVPTVEPNPMGGTYQILKPQTGRPVPKPQKPSKPAVEPAKPSGKVTYPLPTPSKSDIDYLLANPGVAKDFDSRFGEGQAARYLRQKKK